MTSSELALYAGAVLSLFFSYVPGVSDWYGNRSSVQKSGVMALLLLVVAASIFGLSCAKVLPTIACDREGAIGLVKVFIFALIANQATFLASPRKYG